jgi:hypothetical protein
VEKPATMADPISWHPVQEYLGARSGERYRNPISPHTRVADRREELQEEDQFDGSKTLAM